MIFTCNPNSLLVHLDFNVNLKYLNGFDIIVYSNRHKNVRQLPGAIVE